MSEPISQKIGKQVAKWWGWEIVLDVTPPPKCVIIGAHHTAGTDLPLALMFIAASNLPVRWVMKDTMFWFPLGLLWKSLGGIPVNRRTHENFVARMAEQICASEAMMLVIAPDGTRGHAPYWKTGFYHIAQMANVPIVLGFLDFPSKRIGLGSMFTPSGNLEADLEIIRKFYAPVRGKYPERHSEIRFNLPEASPVVDSAD